MSIKICGVYGIFDKKTMTCLYVGQSKDILRRWNSHIKNLKRGKHRRKDFIKWYHSHGLFSMEFRVLETCEDNDFNKNFLEMKWFSILKPKFYGEYPSMNQHWNQRESTKQKISESLRKDRIKTIHTFNF